MINKKHSKLCLRRMGSRKSLTPTDQHSKFCIKSRTRWIRDRIHTIISRRNPTQHGQDYFTGVLPPEIRLLIYGYVLAFDKPIRLQRRARNGLKSNVASILLVNRLIYKEALPVLHELNTIAISREEFCHHPTGKRPQLTCSPEFIQHLYISDLTPSQRCGTKTSPSAPTRNRPCKNCSPCILWLINTLRLEPRLKSVLIDYHDSRDILSGHIQALKNEADMSQNFQIVCTGIGRYKLTSPAIERVQFELQDVPLVKVWSRVTALPSLRPVGPYLKETVSMFRDLKWLKSKVETKDLRNMILKLSTLMRYHDAGLIPLNFASMWPEGVAMDLRCLSALGRPDFLHQLNVQLQSYLEEPRLTMQDLVVRRA